MNEERRKQQILHILAAGIRKVMEEAHLDYGKLQEIRLRTDQPLLILYQGEELFLHIQENLRIKAHSMVVIYRIIRFLLCFFVKTLFRLRNLC